MTKAMATEGGGVIRPSQFARTGSTLRLHHLMEESHRLEIAQRITELREKSRWTQPQIAEMLGLTLRGYQKIEQNGTTKYERAEEIAKIHDVDADWIWEGRGKGETPDLIEALSGSPDLFARLDQIEQTLELLRADVADLGTELVARTTPARTRRRTKPAADS